MNIASALPKISSTQTTRVQTAQEQKTLVQQIVDKTALSANFCSSALTGGVGGIGAYGRSVLGSTAEATGSFYSNLVKAETVGPNLKFIAGVVAIPVIAAGAVMGLPVSLINGMVRGGMVVDSSKPREFTIPQATSAGYNKTRTAWEKGTEGLKEGLAEFGSQKLKEGQQPYDIPIMKTAKSVAVGVAAVAIGGIAGVVSAAVGTVRESAVGVAKAFTDESLNLPGKAIAGVGAVLGGVVHGVTYGLATTVSIIGHGVDKTWEKDSMVQGAKQVFHESGHSIAAAASPKATLLQEKATPEAQ